MAMTTSNSISVNPRRSRMNFPPFGHNECETADTPILLFHGETARRYRT